MRPIKVEFQAFGPYPGAEEVDFEALASKGLFLICGKTGIGKTMILDAMTYALYGQSSGNGRGDLADLRCTNADPKTDTFVRFTFENRGKYYRFERRLEPKRVRLVPVYALMSREEDGPWEMMLENPKGRDLDNMARELIGLDHDQFRQVIVLPQGQFEKLLTSNSSEKEKILMNIFGEEKWLMIAAIFYEEAEERRNSLKLVKEKLERSLAEEECESIDELKELVLRIKQQSEELQESFLQQDSDSVIRKEQEALSLVKRFGDLHKAEERQKELAAKQEERSRWEKTLKEAERAETLRPFLEIRAREIKTLEQRQKEEQAAATYEKKKQQEAAYAGSALQEHCKGEQEAENRKELILRYEGKREDYKALVAAGTELESIEREALKAGKEEQRAKESLEEVTKGIALLQGEYDTLLQTHAALLKEYLAGITGELATRLIPGEPCPVCGSREHPAKAHTGEHIVSEAQVEKKKEEADRKYRQLQQELNRREQAGKVLEEKQAASQKAQSDAAAAKGRLSALQSSLLEGIPGLQELERQILSLRKMTEGYYAKKKELEELLKTASEDSAKAAAGLEAAKKETIKAERDKENASLVVQDALTDLGFASEEECKALMLQKEDRDALGARIQAYDAACAQASETLRELSKELSEIREPDEEECRHRLAEAMKAKQEYSEKQAVLKNNINRLEKKLAGLEQEGEGIFEKIREAEADLAFARKLRGDTGTGLQRYVLGILFSSVIAAANRMLSMVHGGRYRLYRSDEKGMSGNKSGLELKVYDKFSKDREGRSVSTLSGGEKFLTSLALSIGMSAIAQKSDIRIQALFIDEGFGSLDEESIGDAMSILNSIQKANGLVGIISHVAILQDQIPCKLRVEADGKGSHIIPSLG